MPETFHWIEGGGLGRLAAFMHLPEGTGPFPAVLFCHGFTGTRVEPQRLFLSFARRLAGKGLAVLRFDFGGHGESEGEFRDFTISSELQDARAAWDFLGGQRGVRADRRAILGFSLGGYMAARTADSTASEGLKALALWAPVDDPKKRIQLRFLGLHGSGNLEAGATADVGGQLLGPGFLRDMPKHSGILAGEGWRGPVLLAHGEKDEALPPAAAENYEALFRGKGSDFRRVKVSGARHLFEISTQRDRLYDETETFLLRYLGPQENHDMNHGGHGV